MFGIDNNFTNFICNLFVRMMDNEFVIFDHIHECEDCGHPAIVCDCHHGNLNDVFNDDAYQAARECWLGLITEYNKLPFWKRLFTTRPVEPSFEDYIL